MIRQAVLTWPSAGDPAARIAGLTVLQRQLLSLQDAGIERVWLLRGKPLELPPDPRLRLQVEARPVPPVPDRPILRARAGLIWHPALPRRLARAAESVDLEQVPLEPDEFVVATDSPTARREAARRLYRSLIKPTDGVIARNVDRHLSIAITRLLVNTPVTPNQVSVGATLVGFLAMAVVFLGGSRALVSGATLLMLQSVLDGCDGELSRLKYLRSRLGEWLDQVGDDLVNLGYFVAVGLALREAGSLLAAPITWAGVVAHLIYQAALYTALLTRGGGSGSVTSIRWWGQPSPEAKGRESRSRLVRLMEDAGRRDFFVFLYLPCALLGIDLLALAWSAVVFVVSGVTTAAQWLVAGGPEPAGAPGRKG
jgi:phosphatidylglycerophosphate synthase